jgi:hypothetical protein
LPSAAPQITRLARELKLSDVTADCFPAFDLTSVLVGFRPPPPRIFRVREQAWNAGPPTGWPGKGILAAVTRRRNGCRCSVSIATSKGVNTTARTSESVLADWAVLVVANSMPPRDPNDDGDEEEEDGDAKSDDDEPASENPKNDRTLEGGFSLLLGLAMGRANARMS